MNGTTVWKFQIFQVTSTELLIINQLKQVLIRDLEYYEETSFSFHMTNPNIANLLNFGDLMKSVLSIVTMLLTTSAFSQSPTTVQRVVDGDTVVLVGGERVRLQCIDAPESSQAYGSQATNHLEDLLDQGSVSIYRVGEDTYGRTIGYLYVGNMDVNRQMVYDGFAWNYEYYCGSKYYSEEQSARRADRGLWSDPNPCNPYDYRSGNCN